MRCQTPLVEVEKNSLALPNHAEDGPYERVSGEVELEQIRITQDAADTGARVVRLDHTLHDAHVIDRAGRCGNLLLSCRPVLSKIPGEPVHLFAKASSIEHRTTNPDSFEPQRDLVEDLPGQAIVTRRDVHYDCASQVDHEAGIAMARRANEEFGLRDECALRTERHQQWRG